MVLYTPLDESDIFPKVSEDERKFISYEGRTLQVSETQTGEYQIEQLLSTNPQDYLNGSFTPGNVIQHRW